MGGRSQGGLHRNNSGFPSASFCQANPLSSSSTSSISRVGRTNGTLWTCQAAISRPACAMARLVLSQPYEVLGRVADDRGLANGPRQACETSGGQCRGPPYRLLPVRIDEAPCTPPRSAVGRPRQILTWPHPHHFPFRLTARLLRMTPVPYLAHPSFVLTGTRKYASSPSCDGFMPLLPSPSVSWWLSPGCSPCLIFASTYHGTACMYHAPVSPCFNRNPTLDPPSHSIHTTSLSTSLFAPSALGHWIGEGLDSTMTM